MSRVFKFVEESCWDRQDKFRQTRKSVVFRVVSVGKIKGHRVNSTFTADFGVFYDPEDDYLIGHLTDLDQPVDWGHYVFWRRPDLSGIDVIDPSDDRVVAHVVVNRGDPSIPSGEIDTTNVVDLNSWRVEREDD